MSSNTSSAGLFGQSLDGSDLFDQISGPKLFMPIPVTPTNQNLPAPQQLTPAVGPRGSSLPSLHQQQQEQQLPSLQQHTQSLPLLQQHTLHQQKPHNLQNSISSSFAPNQNMGQSFYPQQNHALPGLNVAQTMGSSQRDALMQNHQQQQQQSSPLHAQHQHPQLCGGQYATQHNTTQYQPFPQHQQAHQLQEAVKPPSQFQQPQHVEVYGGNTAASHQAQHTPPPIVTPFTQQQQDSHPQRPTQVVQPIPKHTATTSDAFAGGAQTNYPPTQPDPNVPAEYNISPLPETTEHVDGTPLPVPPSSPHWFYFKDYRKWTPFSYLDSNCLETLFSNTASGNETVSTDGGRYDVNLETMHRSAVYWNEAACEVRRCTWFYKGDSKLVPYDSIVAEMLEKEYVTMMRNGVFNVRVVLSENDFVIFHNPNVLVQYTTSPQEQGWTGEDSRRRPKVVRRGIPAELQGEIHYGEGDEVDHLVLVVHGIGIYSDLRYRSIVECVDDFRRISCNQIISHGLSYNEARPGKRVEFLPIQWHSCVHDERSVDHELKKLTLPSIGKMRNFVNDTLTDILFFTSPIYCQAMCDTVVSEMNRIYKLFKSRNPSYSGSVSLIGHSLGSCILFDILAGQVDVVVDSNEGYMYEDVGDVIDVSSSSLHQRTAPPSLHTKPTAPPSLHTKPSSGPQTNSPLVPIHVLCERLNLMNLLEMFKEEQIDTETIMMCSEADLRDLEIPFGPRKKLLAYIAEQCSVKNVAPSGSSVGVSSPPMNSSSTRGTQTPVSLNSSRPDDQKSEFLFEKTNTGIGQPLVKYSKLEFETSCLFCLGSPIGLFLTSRGIHSLGKDYKLPQCREFVNIFHPYDPVAYRIEPLINESIDIPPSLIAHHKGRKRIHLEIKENLSRAGAQIKHSIMDAVSRTWSSINDFAKAHRQTETEGGAVNTENIGDENETIDSVSSGNTLDSLEETEPSLKEKSLDFGNLNQGGRVDYVLQENPIESLNEYIFALSSHLCYWTSDDTALLVVDKIYKRL